MQRILLEIPLPFTDRALPIYSYGFLMMLAFAAGLWLAYRRAKRSGVEPQVVLDIGLYAVVCGIIGARIAFLLGDLDTPRRLLEYVAIWHGGLTFQGGLFMALAVCLWYLVSRKLPAAKIADLFAPSMAIGVAIGRIGCFLNGCCWGRVAPEGFPLAVVFPEGSLVHGHHLGLLETGKLLPILERTGHQDLISRLPEALPAPVHPTQLYTTAAMLGVFVALLVIERWSERWSWWCDGMLVLVFLMFYSVFRFLIEFVRDDTPLLLDWGAFPGLRCGQILAVLTLPVAAGLFVWLARRARTRGGRDNEEGAS